jgi:hypothetical protein
VTRKSKTLDQVERMQDKAVRFLRDMVLDPDKADEFEAMSPQEYAEHKGITIRENPRSISMADASKAELSNALDDIQDILDDALDPELSREEVVAKVKEAYTIASGDEDEDEETGNEEDEDEPGN